MARPVLSEKEINDLKEKITIKSMVYFQQYGLNQSTEQISKAIGFGKTTLFKYFKTKEILIESAIQYKLDIIKDYETVLFNKTLPYTERYRKAMLFYCVQIFDMSLKMMEDLKNSYPKIYKLVHVFQQTLHLNLTNYYREGIEKGIFHPLSIQLLVKNDEMFFDLLSTKNYSTEFNLSALESFKEYFQIRFNGIILAEKFD